MSATDLPEHIFRINPGDMFSFLCHKDVSCFTNCCRELDLTLTPYDVLRLRSATGLSSSELHKRYIIEEQGPEDIFPSFFLTMVDDGQASCVFVNTEGCSIYEHRPAPCRTYPVGRGTTRKGDVVNEQFVLLQEPHCHGFREKSVQTVHGYMESQKLEPYNRFNDLLTTITQHEKIRQGMQLTASQIGLYKLVLYNLDSFRSQLVEDKIETPIDVLESVHTDDEALLEFGIKLLTKLFFDS